MAAFPKLTSDVIMRYTCRLLWYLVNGIKVSGMPFFFILLSLVSKSIADSNGLDLQSFQTYGTREKSNLVGHNAPFWLFSESPGSTGEKNCFTEKLQVFSLSRPPSLGRTGTESGLMSLPASLG